MVRISVLKNIGNFLAPQRIYEIVILQIIHTGRLLYLSKREKNNQSNRFRRLKKIENQVSRLITGI